MNIRANFWVLVFYSYLSLTEAQSKLSPVQHLDMTLNRIMDPSKRVLSNVPLPKECQSGVTAEADLMAS